MDDYGLNTGTNNNINSVLLSDKNNIFGNIGVMATGLAVPLKAAGRVNYGLHFDLMEIEPLSAGFKEYKKKKMPVNKSRLLLNLLSGRIDRKNIIEELNAQYKYLQSKGFTIKYIDSHQNIHALPVISKCVAGFAAAKGLQGSIRSTKHISFDFRKNFKMLVFDMLGDKNEKQTLVINCPGYGLEYYNVTEAVLRWKQFFLKAKRVGLAQLGIACHPGLGLAESRIYTSLEFKKLLEENNIRIARKE